MLRWATRTRWRRTIVAVLAASPAVMLATVAILWLIFQHRPAWYRPAHLDGSGRQRARSESVAFVDSLSDRIVLGRPFEVVVDEVAVNEWLAVLPDSFPEISRRIPPEVHDAALKFEPGAIWVGALYETGGWRVIVNAAISARVSDDGGRIELALCCVRGGSLPIPWSLVRNALQRDGVGDRLSEGDPIAPSRGGGDAVSTGITIPNDFVWFNGERPIRIRSLAVESSRLRLMIEPL